MRYDIINKYLKDLAILNDEKFKCLYFQLEYLDQGRFDERMFHGFIEYKKADFDEERFLDYINKRFKCSLKPSDMSNISDLAYYIESYINLVELEKFVNGD